MQSNQNVPSLQDLSFNVFQRYYHHYPLSELTYPIRRSLPESPRIKFDVIKDLEYIAVEFRRQTESWHFEFCLLPHHASNEDLVLRKKMPSKREEVEIVVSPINPICFNKNRLLKKDFIGNRTREAKFMDRIQRLYI